MENRAYQQLASEDQMLLQAAVAMLSNAYAPYSQFCVGATVRAKSGKIYQGTNLENASYGLTVCAEMAALSTANTAGDLPTETIAVVGGKVSSPGSVVVGEVITPCGRCRQLIAEVGQLAGENVRVLMGNSNLSEILVGTIRDLLPYAFGATSFQDSD